MVPPGGQSRQTRLDDVVQTGAWMSGLRSGVSVPLPGGPATPDYSGISIVPSR